MNRKRGESNARHVTGRVTNSPRGYLHLRDLLRSSAPWICAIPLVITATAATAQSAASAFTTGYRYDAARRLTGTIYPDPDGTGTLKFAAIRNTYDSAGHLTKVEKGELSSWKSESTPPSAWTGFTIYEIIDTVFDEKGRRTKESISGRTIDSSSLATTSLTQYSYDSMDRVICTAIRMNPAIFSSITTSACSLGAEGVGPNAFGKDRITKNTYDTAGQLTQIRKAYLVSGLDQAYVSYTYTLNGKQEYIIDANGNKSKMEYDGFDRVNRWIFPSTSTAGTINTNDDEVYESDQNGNRIKLTKRDNRTIIYEYDSLNRLTKKDKPGTNVGDIYYDYDAGGHELYARFGSDTGKGIVNEFYDVGWLKATTDSTGSGSRQISYTYDPNGNRATMTHPDGQVIIYGFDGLDRLSDLWTYEPTQGSNRHLINYLYDAAGRRAQLTKYASTATYYTYDPAGRLASLSMNPGGTAYDITDNFTYNPAGQIISRHRDNDNFATTFYNVNRPYKSNGLNQYDYTGTSGSRSAVFQYDTNGNLSQSDPASALPTNFSYFIENQLASVEDLNSGSTVTLSYDPKGRLFEVAKAGSPTTRFLWDGDDLIGELSSGATTTWLRRYVHGAAEDEPLVWYEGAAVDQAGRRFLNADNQGSIITATDYGANTISVNTYDSWGIPGDQNSGRFGYTGQINIPEIGLQYYKARFYSPTLGRFLQTDPSGFDDDFDLYSYVGNDPVNRSDPSGLGTPQCNGTDSYGTCGSRGSTERQTTREVENARRRGVERAWAAERERVKANRPGTVDWTPKEIEELIRTGRVRGYDAHHINTVKGNPIALAENPNNIRFLSRAEHIALHRAVGGTRVPITGQSLMNRTTGVVGGLNIITGILSGRIRTDNLDNMVSDFIGVPSQQDIIQENLRRCGTVNTCA